MKPSTRQRRSAAVIATLSLFVQPATPWLAAAPLHEQTAAKPAASPQSSSPKTTASPSKAAAPSAAAPVDGGWPRMFDLPSGGTILVYQPQIATWEKQAHVVAFSAVSYRSKGGDKPVLGTVKLEADTSVALTERLVAFKNVRIEEANFQALQKDQLREVVEQIDKTMPDDDLTIALDRVLANIDKSQIVPKDTEGVKADPPPIFFSKTAAVMVNLDGEPIWSPIKDNDLKFAVNTNWDLFQYEPTSTYYLRNKDSWLKASDVKGTWSPAGTLPGSFKKLPAEDNWKDVKANLPGKAIQASGVPKVFVSVKPAELILLTGEPAYRPVPGTGLQWVSNTESDVFRMGTSGSVYYLVAGRWFSAPDFTGPWTFATPSLPADFKKISLEHERSRVLASVPGTDQAAEAVLLAQIPQTARVNRKEAKAPDVAFQGDPQFQPIETTTVQRAVNTDKDIFKVGDLYYMCYQGVWFMGKSASGPWEVASSVPQEIYQIPVSSPANHVTYVTIEESNDDWVTFAAAGAYTGMMVAWGCTVWGSGWYYPPYWGYGGYYPYYYGHFPTYGYSAWYNPWTGAYGRSAAVYGPYGGAGVGARYNPRTGTYARGAAAYGPYRRTRRGAGVQPAHGYLCGDAAGVERLWELGIDRGPTRRRLGQDESLHEPADGHDDPHGEDRRGRRGHSSRIRGGRRWCREWRRRLRRQRRERVPEGQRHVAEVRQRRMEQYGQTTVRRATSAHRSIQRRSQHDGSTQSRLGRAPGGSAADPGSEYLPRGNWNARNGQLSGRWGRRRESRRRRPTPVSVGVAR